jgi:hypothetical protein
MHLAAQTEFDCLPRAPVAGQIIRAENAGWITDEFGCGDTGRYLRTGEEIRWHGPARTRTIGAWEKAFWPDALSVTLLKVAGKGPPVFGHACLDIGALGQELFNWVRPEMVALVLLPCW